MNQDIVKIKVPNTRFWVLGEKQKNNTWNAYLIDPETNYKKILRRGSTLKSFVLFSNIVLKTPFPFKQ